MNSVYRSIVCEIYHVVNQFPIDIYKKVDEYIERMKQDEEFSYELFAVKMDRLKKRTDDDIVVKVINAVKALVFESKNPISKPMSEEELATRFVHPWMKCLFDYKFTNPHASNQSGQDKIPLDATHRPDYKSKVSDNFKNYLYTNLYGEIKSESSINNLSVLYYDLHRLGLFSLNQSRKSGLEYVMNFQVIHSSVTFYMFAAHTQTFSTMTSIAHMNIPLQLDTSLPSLAYFNSLYQVAYLYNSLCFRVNRNNMSFLKTLDENILSNVVNLFLDSSRRQCLQLM